jgi:hypothetical protein
MTGTQVALALVSWDRDFGCLLAIPILGIWGMLAAVKARRFRAAYSLAAWVLGIAFYVSLSLPASSASYQFLLVWKYWPDFTSVVAMCMAAGFASLVFEHWIGKRSPRHVAFVGLGMTYLTMAIYPLAWIVAGAIFYRVTGPPPTWPGTMNVVSPDFGSLCLDALRAVPRTVLVTTLSLHVVLPVGLAGAFLLRWILLLGTDLSQSEKGALSAVEELQFAGRDPIRCYHVARCMGCDAQTAENWLEKLLLLHRVTWSPRHGFRRIR